MTAPSSTRTAAPEIGTGTLVVQTAVAPLHGEARISSPQTSQRTRGALLAVLDRSGDEWMRVRGEDGYEGWVHRGYVAAEDASHPASAFGRISLGCGIRTRGGHRMSLPLGALLRDDDTVVAGRAVALDSTRRDFPAGAKAIIHTACTCFEGTPYQWGGITPWGADCSGLVQTCYGLHGIPLPRDAWQQAEAEPPGGADTVRRLEALHPGDLLFFSDRSDGKITHVGIALGEMKMVHLALGRGGWALEQLSRTDDPYVAKLVERFLFARRLELQGTR